MSQVTTRLTDSVHGSQMVRPPATMREHGSRTMARCRGKIILVFLALLASLTNIGSGLWPQGSPAFAANPLSHLIGTFVIAENWGQQSLIEETGLGVVRLAIQPNLFVTYLRNPTRFDWSSIDREIGANAGRTVMLTLSPAYPNRRGTDSALPETRKDVDTFLDFVSTLAQRHSKVVKYWQLENEITNPKNWPPERYADYAKLLSAFHDVVRKASPEARIMVAGIPAAHIDGPNLRNLLRALVSAASGKFHAVDIHHHRSWLEGGAILDSIMALRKVMAGFPNLDRIEFVVSENSTWIESPGRRGYQSEAQQAVYAVQSFHAAMAGGARFCVFGTLVDRLQWKEKTEHVFTFNGLFYHPEKEYSTGRHKGPKPVAFSVRLIAELTRGVEPGQVTSGNTGRPNVFRFDVRGKRPYSIVWWSGHGATIDVEIPLPVNCKTARVVGAIPDRAAKWPPTDPFAGFPSTLLSARDGKLAVRLSPNVPVYVLPEMN